MKALILDGKVMQIETEEFEVHSDWEWVECDDTVGSDWNYDGTNFINPDTRTDAEKVEETLDRLRRKRKVRLDQSDWTQVSDSSLSPKQKTDWATYRQELRDITDTYTSLEDVVWPTKPS